VEQPARLQDRHDPVDEGVDADVVAVDGEGEAVQRYGVGRAWVRRGGTAKRETVSACLMENTEILSGLSMGDGERHGRDG